MATSRDTSNTILKQSSSFHFVLPCHLDETIEDPLSICGDYESLIVPKWLFIETLLNRRIDDIDSLLEVIDCLQPDIELECLRVCLEDFVCYTEEIFFSQTVPAMIKLALRMPELFPTGKLLILRTGVECQVAFTREQVACLLVHMFLCSLQPSSENTFWVNFSIWYKTPVTAPMLCYLQTLLTYFQKLDCNGLPAEPLQNITFSRRVLTQAPNWHISEVVTKVVTAGSGVEPGEGEVQVVFSNKDIGYGSSGTQEEAVFGMSPEMCIAILITQTLLDNEAILIKGPEIIGRYTGIGRELKFNGPWLETRDWSQRKLVAIDAMEFDIVDADEKWEVEELKEVNLQRELNKCFCGFGFLVEENYRTAVAKTTNSNNSALTTNLAESTIPTIATGHWGCGAFGGHRQTKALIQLMAAFQANTNLVFYEILVNDEEQESFVSRFVKLSDVLDQKKVTVARLYEVLLCTGHMIQNRKVKDPDVFDLVMKQL